MKRSVQPETLKLINAKNSESNQCKEAFKSEWKAEKID